MEKAAIFIDAGYYYAQGSYAVLVKRFGVNTSRATRRRFSATWWL